MKCCRCGKEIRFTEQYEVMVNTVVCKKCKDEMKGNSGITVNPY